MTQPFNFEKQFPCMVPYRHTSTEAPASFMDMHIVRPKQSIITSRPLMDPCDYTATFYNIILCKKRILPLSTNKRRPVWKVKYNEVEAYNSLDPFTYFQSDVTVINMNTYIASGTTNILTICHPTNRFWSSYNCRISTSSSLLNMSASLTEKSFLFAVQKSLQQSFHIFFNARTISKTSLALTRIPVSTTVAYEQQIRRHASHLWSSTDCTERLQVMSKRANRGCLWPTATIIYHQTVRVPGHLCKSQLIESICTQKIVSSIILYRHRHQVISIKLKNTQWNALWLVTYSKRSVWLAKLFLAQTVCIGCSVLLKPLACKDIFNKKRQHDNQRRLYMGNIPRE